MELRDATPNDVEGIRAAALASMRESYGHVLDEDVLQAAVDRWYDAEDLADAITDPATAFPVAVKSEEVIGFAESYVVDRRERVGEIDWLHVHPDHRGEGLGTQLLARVEEDLRDRDVEVIEGRVLVDNEVGTRFFEREGYENAGERTVDIGHETFHERRYVKRLVDDEPDGEQTRTTPDGEEVFVAFDESDRGSEGPLYAVYTDADHEERYGFLCGNCESLDIAVDTMDRVQCNECGNQRKPSRWDDAYL